MHSWELASWCLVLGEKATPRGAIQSINDAWSSDRTNTLSLGARTLSKAPKELLASVLELIRGLEEWEVPADVWFMRNMPG